ncbi:hypothetical protein L2E82_01030 [Cichorium intybus]|uniref:Uncharacterized protein n=1 Tax=Cichorium intybus TaxID=13427 RepID=A0ACB9GZ74_CICIN|nr:hypothetical protein L2E82_01030 [Cichorium intybus]
MDFNFRIANVAPCLTSIVRRLNRLSLAFSLLADELYCPSQNKAKSSPSILIIQFLGLPTCKKSLIRQSTTQKPKIPAITGTKSFACQHRIIISVSTLKKNTANPTYILLTRNILFTRPQFMNSFN